MWRGISRVAAHWGSTLASCITSRAGYPWERAKRLLYPSHGNNTNTHTHREINGSSTESSHTPCNLNYCWPERSRSKANFILHHFSNVYLIKYAVDKIMLNIHVYTHSIQPSVMYLFMFVCLCAGLKFSLEKQSLMMTSAMNKPVSSTILVS